MAVQRFKNANGEWEVINEGGIAEESDPIFTASPAAKITDSDIARWNAGGSGSIDPALLEGYIPMMRDFSDDFNDDFAR